MREIVSPAVSGSSCDSLCELGSADAASLTSAGTGSSMTRASTPASATPASAPATGASPVGPGVSAPPPWMAANASKVSKPRLCNFAASSMSVS